MLDNRAGCLTLR